MTEGSSCICTTFLAWLTRYISGQTIDIQLGMETNQDTLHNYLKLGYYKLSYTEPLALTNKYFSP